MADRGWEVVDDWGVEPDDHIVESAKNAPVDPRRFSLNKDPYYSGYDAVRDEDKKTKWSDVGQALKVGAINTAEAPVIISDYMTSGAIGSEARREAELTKRDIMSEMTPQGRRAATAPFLGDKEHEGAFDVGIGDYLTMGAAQNAAPMVMSLIPAWMATGIAARAGLGAVAQGAIGAGVARGASAAQNMADVTSSIFDEVENTPTEKLKEIPRIQQFMSEGMNFEDARGRYRTEVAQYYPFIAAVIGAVGAAPEASFIKTLAGSSGKKGLLKGAISQIGGGAAEEFGEEGSGAALAEMAGSKAGLSDIDYHNIISSALGGAAQGGVLHAPTALVHLGADAIAPEQKVALSTQTSTEKVVPPAATVASEQAPPPPLTSPNDAINAVNNAEIPADLAAALRDEAPLQPVNPSTPATDLFDQAMSAQLPPDIATNVPTQRAPIDDEADAWEAFDNWGQENTPDVIRYDDGTTEEVMPAPLRKRSGSPREGWMTPATERALGRREASLTAPVNEEPSEQEYWDAYDEYKNEQAAPQETEAPITSEVTPEQTVQSSDGVTDEPAPVTGAKGRKARRTAEQIAADKEARAAAKVEKAAAKEAVKAENIRVGNNIPQLDDDGVKSRLKAATARIRNSLNGKGRLKTSEVELPLVNLVSQQDWIEPARKKPALGTNEPPVVVHVGGKLVLRDGNHRVSAMLDRGDTTAKVRLIELDPYETSDGPAATPAEKAARNKAPTKAKSTKPDTADETVKSAGKTIAPSGVIEPLYVNVAKRLTTKTRVSAEGSHESNVEKAKRANKKKVAEEEFYNPEHEPSKDEAHAGAEQADLLRGDTSPKGTLFIRSDKQRKSLKARLQKFIKAIEDRAGTINPNVTKNSSNYELYARVAKDVLKYIDNNSGRAQQALDDFISDEMAARKGDFGPMRKRRLEEGDQQSRPNNQLNEETNSGATASIGAQAFPAPDEIEDVVAEQRKTDMMNAAREIIRRQMENNRSVDLGSLYLELANDFSDVIEDFPFRNQQEVEAALRADLAKENAPKEKSGGAMSKKVTAKVTEEVAEEAVPEPPPKRTISKEESDRYVQMLNETAKRDAERSAAPKATRKEDITIWEKEPVSAASTGKKLKEETLYAQLATAKRELNKLVQVANSYVQTSQETTNDRVHRERVKALNEKIEQAKGRVKQINNKISDAEAGGIFGDLPTQAKPKKVFPVKEALDRKLYSLSAIEDDIALVETELEERARQDAAELEERARQGELFLRSPAELTHAEMQQRVDQFRKEYREEYPFKEKSYGIYADEDGSNPVLIGPDGGYPILQISNVRDMLAETRKGAHRNKLRKFVVDLVTRLAGDVNVIVLSDEDYYKNPSNKNAAGHYSHFFNHIVLPARSLTLANYAVDNLVLHESLHAALQHRLSENLVAQHQIQLLTDYLHRIGFMDGAYMYANVHEFMSEVLSREDLQEGLRRIELTPELAKILGIEQWRANNLWQAIVQTFAKWLGYVGPYNALEGTLSVADRIAREDISVPREFQERNFKYTNHYTEYRELGGGYTPTGVNRYYTVNGAVTRKEYGKQISRRGARKRLGMDQQLYSRPDVTSAVIDTVSDQSNAYLNKIKRFGIKAATLDQLRQSTAGLFVDKNGNDMMEKLVSTIQRMAPYAQTLRDQSDKLATRFMDLKRLDPDMADRFADLALEATTTNVRLGPGADNKHLEKGGRNAQGSGRLAELQREFNSLSPEAQKLYSDMAAYYRTMQNEHARGIVENRLQQYEVNPRDRQGFIDRVISGTTTKSDENLFKDKPKAFDRIKEVSDLRVIQGDYFPLMRYGRFVVNTKNNINDLMGGTEIEPGKVEFRAKTEKAARALAEAFAENIDLPQTNFQRSPTSQANDFGFIVSVQRNGAHFFESEAEAIKWRRDNTDKYDQISEVSPIRETGKGSSDLTTGQLNSLMATVKNSTYSDEEKEAMLDMLKQGSAVLMSGNRIQKRGIARRKVLGASNDFSRNVLQYGEAASSRLAQLKFRPQIDEALNEMREVNKNLMDKEAPKRTAVLNEVSARIDEGVTNVKEPGKFIKDLMTLTFLGKLASPMYSVVNAMQPWMVTLPVLSGRFGAVRAASVLQQAYSSLGFSENVMAGIANTYRAGKNFNATTFDTTDTVASIKKNLAKDADGAELNRLIDQLLERGAMSVGGFELAQSISQGRSKWWGVPLAQVDRIARQLPQSIEDINRAATAVAAYRLARSSMTEEKARAFAFDTVMNTQGDYSGVNAPRAFNNKYLRPALQFKKYAQMMGYLLADMSHRAFSGADVETRREARKQLTAIMGVQIAMAGALSLPGIEIAKVGFMVAGALGIGGGWDDEEEKLRKLADDTFSKTWGELITRGVVSRALNIDLSQRLSLADMVTFGEPGDYERDGVDAYLWRTFMGAPYSTINDFRKGIQDAVEGDFGKAAERVIPVKVIADAFKAANKYSDGKVTALETAMNVFGVKSGRQAEENRKVGNNIRNNEAIAAKHKELTNKYLAAKTAGERIKIRAQIVEFNKTAPLRQKVFPNSLEKVRHRQEMERVS